MHIVVKMDIEKIRRDFPILQKGINGKSIIYMDNSCMTLRPIQVIEAMNEYYYKYPACHGRSYHKLGLKVTEEYDKARQRIQRFLNAKKPEEIIFTRNTTEAINIVANSLALKKGDVVLTTDKEHNSNLLPWQMLTKNGIKHEIVFSNKDNTFSLETFQEKMNKNVKLVSMVHTSNLDGVTVPAKEIIKIAHDFNALVLLDGAQSAPHKQIDVKKLDVDFFAFSGHKMLGPSGIGALYGKRDLLENLNPFLVGGDTVKDSTYDSCVLMGLPEKFEAGLQNYAGAIGFGAAAEYIRKIGKENIEKHETELNKLATKHLEEIPQVKIIGPEPEKRGGIISFNVEKIHPHDISAFLDEYNIMIRSGAHCVHSWFNAHKIDGSARASLYLYNTKKETEKFIEALKRIIKTFG